MRVSDEFKCEQMLGNFEIARNWNLNQINNKKIKIIAKSVINAMEKYGVWIYHISKYDSVYLKFKDTKMGSVRIADHESHKTHLKYTWNILLDCGDIPEEGIVKGNMNFYRANKLLNLFSDLDDRFKSINQNRMDFRNLIGKNLNVKLQNPNCHSKVVEIEENKTGEQNMKTKNIAAVLMENCKTIGVHFSDGNKTYTYKTTEDFKVGDYAVVNTPNYQIQGEHSGLTIAIVTEVHKVPNIDVDSNINYQWIVQKVDMSNYNEMNLREDKFNDHLLEIQQKTVKKNAINMLAEHLGTEINLLQDAMKILHGVKDE
jgi:hypothetical protein